MLYLNQEVAQSLLDTTDKFTFSTLCSIHNEMIREANLPSHPKMPFDMCMFYNTALKAVSAFLGHNYAGPFAASEPALAANLPVIGTDEWQSTFFVQSGLVSQCVKVLERESVSSGRPFDVGFACKIWRGAFTDVTIKEIRNSIGKTHDPDPDMETWCEGFFTVAPKESLRSKDQLD